MSIMTLRINPDFKMMQQEKEKARQSRQAQGDDHQDDDDNGEWMQELTRLPFPEEESLLKTLNERKDNAKKKKELAQKARTEAASVTRQVDEAAEQALHKQSSISSSFPPLLTSEPLQATGPRPKHFQRYTEPSGKRFFGRNPIRILLIFLLLFLILLLLLAPCPVPLLEENHLRALNAHLSK
eukprot:3675223-Pyramimonas_sp.AAC.1